MNIVSCEGQCLASNANNAFFIFLLVVFVTLDTSVTGSIDPVL